jgi:hypothetical protein
MQIDIGTINFVTLREQKRCLLECADKYPILNGLVFLIDQIQDDAVDRLGFSNIQVFGKEV